MAAFLNALNGAPTVPGSFFVGPRAERLIYLAEQRLGVVLPESYREFVRKLGAGNLGGQEIFGLIDENFSEAGVPDMVWVTLKARAEWRLPPKYMVINFDGMGGYLVLNGSPHQGENEPKVASWNPILNASTMQLEDGELDFASTFVKWFNEERGGS